MSIEILSINAMDSPFNSWGDTGGMKLLAKGISNLNPSVVFIQELISKKSARALKDGLKGYNFYGGVDEPKKYGGLLIATKEPAKDPKFSLYSRQAYWNPLSLGDWYLGKGFFEVVLGSGKNKTKFVNSHTVCNYFGDYFGYRALRTQLMQLADYIQKQKGKVVVGGDFNLVSDTPIYHEFIKRSGLFDPLGGKGAITFNPHTVAWPWKYFSKWIYGANKFDYTLIKGVSKDSVSQKVVLTKPIKIDNKSRYVSDHYGLLTSIK